MSKRNRSPDPRPRRKRSSPTLSVGALHEQRLERLQMLGLLSDDVLGMVCDFVCPPESKANVLLEHGAKLMALGRPLSDTVTCRSSVIKLEKKMRSAPTRRIVGFLTGLNRSVPAAARTALCAELYAPLGRKVEERAARTLLKAAMGAKQFELVCCAAEHETLCHLVAGDFEAVGGHVGALSVALRWHLWVEAGVLSRAPYNRCATTHDLCIIIDGDRDAWRAPEQLWQYLLQGAHVRCLKAFAAELIRLDCTALLGDLVKQPGVTFRDQNGLAAQACSSALRLNRPFTALTILLDHNVPTDESERTMMIADIIDHKQDANQKDTLNRLISQGFDRIRLCSILVQNNMALACPFMQEITDPADLKTVMTYYKQWSRNGFESDLDALERLPMLAGMAGELRMLDACLIAGLTPPFSLYDRATSLGLRIVDKGEVLKVLIERDKDKLLEHIVATDCTITNDDLTDAVLGLKPTPFSMACVRSILDLGRINKDRLIAGLARQIVHSTMSSVHADIADYYAPNEMDCGSEPTFQRIFTHRKKHHGT